MFLAGGRVKSGLHGSRPDLSRLDPVGDVVHAIDFRSVYASVLKSWLKADPHKLFSSDVQPLEGLIT